METLLERGEHDLGALQTGGAGDGVGPQLVHTVAAPCFGVGLCMSAWSDRVHLHLHDVAAGHGIVSVLRLGCMEHDLQRRREVLRGYRRAAILLTAAFCPATAIPRVSSGNVCKGVGEKSKGTTRCNVSTTSSASEQPRNLFFSTFTTSTVAIQMSRCITSAAAMLCLPVYPPSMHTAHSNGDSQITCIHPAANKISIFR